LSVPTIQKTTSPTNTDSNDNSPATTIDPTAAQHFPAPPKTRDKLETISERIETQESQISQITSLNQSPPLQRPPKSSKWKWLKTGSTGPDTQLPSRQQVSTNRAAPSLEQQPTNPFDVQITDDEDGAGERRLSIPMSLFIPRSARQSLKIVDDSSSENVNESLSFRKTNQTSFFLFFAEKLRRISFGYQCSFRSST